MISISPASSLQSLLMQAYRPRCHFGRCREAQWAPSDGHIPRGFLGAVGELGEVELIMVFAEPGHPHSKESYNLHGAPDELLSACTAYAYRCFRDGQDLFHRNARWFMEQIYPDLDFDDRLRRIWITEGRLCSIDNEIGNARDVTCAETYLIKQLNLMPRAAVVAFGGKARRYLERLGIDHIGCYALSPPGASHRPARPSWERAIAAVRERL